MYAYVVLTHTRSALRTLLYILGMFLGILLLVGYHTHASALNAELWAAFGVLAALAGSHARRWAGIVGLGALVAWIGVDPTRDMIATTALASAVVGAAVAWGFAAWVWHRNG